MRASDFLLIVSGVLSMTMAASAATRYVDLNNPAPLAPYTSWATAATNIQTVVDAAAAGDEIVVTNGTYASGGRAVYGKMTNRVAINKAVTVRSVNGPLVTIIEGRAAPSPTNYDSAVRCVYVGTNAFLSGFTLTNGHTLTTGDASKERSGGGAWCEVSGLISNCTLIGNLADRNGGGAYGGVLNNCTVRGNSAPYGGGGVSDGTLNTCILSGNSASYGGGAFNTILSSCTLRGNSASGGGGVCNCNSFNCSVMGNSASWGGGASGGILYNCTLVGNSARDYGGGASSAGLRNCILYYNLAPKSPNYEIAYSALKYCCTLPLPPGPGNIDSEPLLAFTGHLLAQSPCIGRGSSNYISGVDIDGEQWLDPPCIGADQFVPGHTTGALTLAIDAIYTNVAAGFPVPFIALNKGRITAMMWDFGDGTVVSNRVSASHAWATPGLYTVRLTGYNDGWPGGVSTTAQIQVEPRKVYFVNVANITPSYPFTDWAGAATNIQDAIDAGTQVGRLVLVADGVYKAGGRAVYGMMTNRVVVTEGVEVRSVNGPLLTFIEGQMAPGLTNGDGAIRCAYMGTNAVLSGFTLTNGHTRALGDIYKEQSGGGALCEVSATLTNCTLGGNFAQSYGGGTYYGVLKNCTLIGNSAGNYGGGACEGTLNNCTLSGNSAKNGGATAYGTLDNCMLMGNSASDGGGASTVMLNNCTLSGNSASNNGGGASGSTLNNCTLVGNSASDGGGASSATLNNCTLSGNSASNYGGGASAGILNNCTLTVNSASSGGGTYGGMLTNCTLSGNSASNYGGGVFAGTLINCTLVGNSASDGGGAYSATLKNCIVYYNIAPKDANYAFPYFSYCCTTPLPRGQGNIEAAPGLLDIVGWSDLRLQANSPCINAGARGCVFTSADLDGSPRVVGGTVDMGAYEFQSPASSISYGWLQQYGFSIDGLADFVDSDIDGANNWQEWVAGTNPTNSASALRMITVLPDASAPNEITVSWTSVTNRTYCLERALILGAAPGFGVVRSNITGLDTTTTFTDTNATAPGPFFYRVRVEN